MRRRLRYGCVWAVVLSWASMGAPGAPGPAMPQGREAKGAAPIDAATQYEMEVGRSAARELEQRYGLCTDEAINARVRRVSAPVLRACGSRIPISIRVLKSDEPNGIALPGGFIFVTQGLLRVLKEDDLLAAAFGHEVAHIALGHMTKMLQEQAAGRRPRVEPPVDEDYPEPPGPKALESPDLPGAPEEVRKRPTESVVHTREKEADRAAARYLRSAGIDPRAVVRLLARLSEQPELDASNSETHPTWPDRIRNVEEYLNSAEFRREGTPPFQGARPPSPIGRRWM